MIFNIILCFLLLLGLQAITPHWWWIMIVPLLWGVIRGKGAAAAFMVGMTSAGILWLAASIYYWQDDGALIVNRVDAMLSIGSPWLLIAATAAIAVIAGGVSALTGQALNSALRRKQTNSH
jgi:hypothetical protein